MNEELDDEDEIIEATERLIIVGTGDKSDSLRRMISEHGLLMYDEPPYMFYLRHDPFPTTGNIPTRHEVKRLVLKHSRRKHRIKSNRRKNHGSGR